VCREQRRETLGIAARHAALGGYAIDPDMASGVSASDNGMLPTKWTIGLRAGAALIAASPLTNIRQIPGGCEARIAVLIGLGNQNAKHGPRQAQTRSGAQPHGTALATSGPATRQQSRKPLQ